MPQSLANFDAALKDDYGPGLKNALNNMNPIFTEATRNEEDIVGRRAVWSVHTRRSGSTGARAELSALPSADRQGFTQVSDDLKYVYHTIKVSGQSKALTRNDTGSFARALETEINGAEKDIKFDLSRQVVGQAVSVGGSLKTGVIALTRGDPGTDTDFIWDDGTNELLDDSQNRYFFRGQRISFLSPTTGLARTEPSGGYEVASVAKATNTVTVTSAIDSTVADNDLIVRYGNYDNEVNGLRHLVHTTQSYAGVDPATVPEWAALEVGSRTTPISEVLLDEADELVQTDGDGSAPNLWLAEYVQRRKLASIMQAQKRFDGRQRTLQSGWKGLDIAQGTLVIDRFIPEQEIFGITTKSYVQFVGLDFSWDDDDGKILYKALDDSDAVQARYKAYINFEATVRNAHVHVLVSTPSF
jgi:hypothetical protein